MGFGFPLFASPLQCSNERGGGMRLSKGVVKLISMAEQKRVAEPLRHSVSADRRSASPANAIAPKTPEFSLRAGATR